MARRTNTPIFVADFETTNDVDDCRVWGWGLVEVGAQVSVEDCVIGTTLLTFLEYCADMGDSIVYFHNLKFDGSFIIDFLFRNGYSHTENAVKPGEFSCVVSRLEQHYKLSVRWHNGAKTVFQDSLKKLPLSVDNVAKSFGLEITKLSIDYNAHRPVGYCLSRDEALYIAHDIVIVARALAAQFAVGMDRLTVGSDSLYEFESIYGGKKGLQKLLPVLDRGVDADVRQAYRGGWTYCDPRRAGDIVGPGKVYDINSMYPYIMRTRLLPWGVPTWFDGEFIPTESWPLAVFSVTFTAAIKPDHVPCIQVKSSPLFGSSQYLDVIEEPITLTLTSVDWALWRDHYDIDVLSYEGGWRFKGRYGIFDEYIDKWYSVKENSSGGTKYIAKLHLNSLYGKMATNPDVTGKVPIMEDDCVRYVRGAEDTRDPVYTPIGVFITSYSRDYIIRAAQVNYDSFLYADTDSLHLLTDDVDSDPPGMVVGGGLGEWKLEKLFDYACFWRAKQYIERTPDGKYETHIAGLPPAVAENVRFCDFHEGRVFTGKLSARKVPGGTVLSETTFRMRESARGVYAVNEDK